jgi:hypothetical protein
VSTKDIRPSVNHTTCDVCGRTLLRGESPELYVAAGERRLVCDLCTSRAREEGWVREGTVPNYDPGDGGRERRRSVLGWLRSRRGAEEDLNEGSINGPEASPPAFATPEPTIPTSSTRFREPRREPRHVRAVPTSVEHKVSSAVEVFNGSEHARTTAGVARSLGSPVVSVRASEAHASTVTVVVAWELCWYRYEIDLSDEVPSVRLAAQGAELDELEASERDGNATADEDGMLAIRQ